MIEVFKIMRSMDRVEREQLFPLLEGSVMRRHKLKMKSVRFMGDLRKNIFTQMVLMVRNALPGRVVEAGCLKSFKKYFHEHLARHNIQGYGTAGKLVWLGRSGHFKRRCRLDGPKGLFCSVVFCDSVIL